MSGERALIFILGLLSVRCQSLSSEWQNRHASRLRQRARKSAKTTSAKAAPVASQPIAAVQTDAERTTTTQPNQPEAAQKDAKDTKKEGEAAEEAKDEKQNVSPMIAAKDKEPGAAR